MTVTLDGGLVVIDPAGSYTPANTSGTLGSGQQFTMYAPTSGPAFPLVVYCHSAGGTETQLDDPGVAHDMALYLCARGFTVIAGRLTGNGWANAATLACVDELITHADGNSPADTADVMFVGLSMGMVPSCAWTNANPGRTVAIASLVGGCDLGYLHDNGFESSIDTAYGDHAGYLAAYDTSDPLTIAESGALDTIPIGIWYGSSDTTTGVAETAAFHAAAPLSVLQQDVLNHFGIGLAYGPQIGSWLLSHHPPAAQSRTLLV